MNHLDYALTAGRSEEEEEEIKLARKKKSAALIFSSAFTHGIHLNVKPELHNSCSVCRKKAVRNKV